MKFFSKFLFFVSLTSVFLFSEGEIGQENWVYDYATRVQDFPKKDINFLCYPHLLENSQAFKTLIKTIAKRYENHEITKIAGLEARGFIFGVALAYEMDLPFVMVRKKGKLPRLTKSMKYGLEYGSDEFQVEVESLNETDKVLIVDDLLATGGTAEAAVKLVEECGASVDEVVCIFELGYLDGREKVPADVFTLLKVDE